MKRVATAAMPIDTRSPVRRGRAQGDQVDAAGQLECGHGGEQPLRDERRETCCGRCQDSAFDHDAPRKLRSGCAERETGGELSFRASVRTSSNNPTVEHPIRSSSATVEPRRRANCDMPSRAIAGIAAVSMSIRRRFWVPATVRRKCGDSAPRLRLRLPGRQSCDEGNA